MIVLFDMDDVIADTSECLYKILRKEHPDILEFQHDRTHHDIKDEYSPENLKIVQSVLYSPDFQLSMPAVPGSLEAVLEIDKRGHNVIFCSTPHAHYETCVVQKYQWLEARLGRTFARKLMLSDDKTIVYGDLLIDDKPEIKGLRHPSWEHVLFTRSYNLDVHDKRRLDSWNNWRDILSEL